MNWLKKISYIGQSDPLVEIVSKIILNTPDPRTRKVPDLQTVKLQLQQAEAQGADTVAVCELINASASGVNPNAPDTSAYKKMMQLAQSLTSCNWNPISPPMGQEQQQQQNDIIPPAPMMGQQEAPMEMPSAEIG